VYREYALGLFAWLPFVFGVAVTLIYGYKNEGIAKRQLRNLSYLALLLFSLGLLAFAWEGIICIIMAAPIGLFFTWLGYRLGYWILRTKLKQRTATIVVLMFVSVPCLVAFEHSIHDDEAIRSVTTSIEIDASPETVWKHVVVFPRLQEPTEFIFKTGIAYPVDATIDGQGVGAIRHCNFSTGSFTEPITVWEEPRLLKFSVVDQPEPMKELSPYDIHPNHLHGYWVSKEGQFNLVALPNGRTRLEGTTWYVNKIKPAVYWTIWSDHIVHKIHNRVLAHIKLNAEKH
jgi:hypothetical protein